MLDVREETPGVRITPMVYRAALVGRRGWWGFLGGFLEPVLYLFALGTGLGAVVGEVSGPSGQPLSYVAFMTPALLGAATMNAAVAETTMTFFFKLRFARLYESVVATSMRVPDILFGEITWSGIRGCLYAVGFLVTSYAVSAATSPWAVLAVPFAFLAAVVFAAIGTALTSFMTSWEDSQLVQVVTVPMLLFSGTFYPVDPYPGWLEALVHVFPLYHVNVVLRHLFAGVWSVSATASVAFLCCVGAAAVAVAVRRMHRHLLV